MWSVKLGGGVIGENLLYQDAIGIIIEHHHQEVLRFLDVLNEAFPYSSAQLREALYKALDQFPWEDEAAGRLMAQGRFTWTCPVCGLAFEISRQ